MISEEELRRQAEEASRELQQSSHKSDNNPVWLIAGIGIALLIVMMIVPLDYFGRDRNPTSVPTLADVQTLVSASDLNVTERETDYLRSMIPSDPVVKRVANRIITEGCNENRVCHAKALFYFVRDEVTYVRDPPKEYLENPVETLLTGGADCDGHAILLANLLQATGFYTRFVFVPQHSYVQLLIPDAPSHYKDAGNWINLDPTCKTCEFGEIPRENKDLPKDYLG